MITIEALAFKRHPHGNRQTADFSLTAYRPGLTRKGKWVWKQHKLLAFYRYRTPSGEELFEAYGIRLFQWGGFHNKDVAMEILVARDALEEGAVQSLDEALGDMFFGLRVVDTEKEAAIAEEKELRETCFHCGYPAMPKTFGENPRCERHYDV